MAGLSRRGKMGGDCGGKTGSGLGPAAAPKQIPAVEVPMIARRLGWVAAAVAAGLVLAVAATQAEDKVDPDKIPKVVMDTLKSKFPKPEITKCTKEKEGGAVVYDIEFKQDGRKCEADIKEDGTMLNFEKEIALKDLPEAITKAVEKKYPKSTLKEAMEVTEIKDKKEVMDGYEINLQTADKKDVEVVVSPDGKIKEDSGEKKKDDK